MVGVEPVVAEHVAAELGRGHEPPVDVDRAGQLLGQQRLDVAGGLADLLGQLALALRQPAVRLVAFEQVDVAARVVADAGDQLELVGQLDQVVVGPEGERLGLDGRLLLAGQHDHAASRASPGWRGRTSPACSPSMSGMTRSCRMTVGCTSLAVVDRLRRVVAEVEARCPSRRRACGGPTRRRSAWSSTSSTISRRGSVKGDLDLGGG